MNTEDIPILELQNYFGEHFAKVQTFNEMLVTEGELRGLIGPRELDKLWSRHILNSAALVPHLPETGSLADIGSGAGFPGVLVAILNPQRPVYLIEPMARRVDWLTEVTERLALSNVTILRGRAEEFHGGWEFQSVTSRAVASLDKLARFSLPLLEKNGQFVILKGKNVLNELPAASKVWLKYKMTKPEIIDATTIPGVESTTVLKSVRRK